MRSEIDLETVPNVATVTIFDNGRCLVLDPEAQTIEPLCGLWEDCRELVLMAIFVGLEERGPREVRFKLQQPGLTIL